jgi:sortase B
MTYMFFTENSETYADVDDTDVKPVNVQFAEDETFVIMDFTELISKNSDICAWVTVDDTNIDYPVVQGDDNSYYLHNTAMKEKAKQGSIFMDYRTPNDFSCFSTILYGHHMKSGVMFADVAKFKEKAYYDAHKSGTLYTQNATYALEIFACSVTPSDSDYYKFQFASSGEKEDFIKMLKKSSRFYDDVKISTKDHLVLLSTCSYEFEEARTIIVAKLTKKL